MAVRPSEAVNELSESQGAINEEPDLSVYYEARELWVLDQAIRESEARKEGYIEGYFRVISRDTLLDI